MITLYALAATLGLGVLWLGTNLRVVKQFERGVVFRFGRVQSRVRGPGLTMLMPIADRLDRVNMQIITMPVPAQDGITRDNVTVRVDAVIYFNVADPVRVAVDVQDYVSAIGQVAQTSLRSIIGKSDLDDLLCNREGLNQGLELMIDSPALGWGVHIHQRVHQLGELPRAVDRRPQPAQRASDHAGGGRDRDRRGRGGCAQTAIRGLHCRSVAGRHHHQSAELSRFLRRGAARLRVTAGRVDPGPSGIGVRPAMACR
jgi:hypothetical protein